ncbi:MAG: tRNA (adenosine(37)-N6)-threonylcarbamoyltransferase complex dimerization subunit type 1 TsaB, partial [Phormidesmis sp.]
FGAIYSADGKGGLQSVLGDEVFPKDKWRQIVASWERPLQQVSIEMGEGIAASVAGVMKLACSQWAQGERPEWNAVMPFYGQHPVNR